MNTKRNKKFNYPTNTIKKHPVPLIRELALWIYRNSPRPNQSISLLSAHVVVTGIAQRAYLTPTHTGLNMNWWLIANTGWGKDSFLNAMGSVCAELAEEQPSLSDIIVGKPASGQALERIMSERPKCLIKVAEAGAWWRELLSPNRPSHIDSLYNAVLNLFMMTDKGREWKCRQKAKRDDEVKPSVYRPACSFFGESTPEDMFGDLSHESVGTGLISRQVIFILEKAEYSELNIHREPMSPKLKERLLELIIASNALDHSEEVIKVEANKEARRSLYEYSEGHNRYMYEDTREQFKADLFNRSGLKAYRLASLYAVCEDPHEPMITLEMAESAIKLIQSCDTKLYKKFTSGEVGKGQLKQQSDFISYLEKHSKMSKSQRAKSWKLTKASQREKASKVLADKTVVPKSKVVDACKKLAAFRNDYRGALTASSTIVTHLCKEGLILEISREEAFVSHEYPFPLIQLTSH